MASLEQRTGPQCFWMAPAPGLEAALSREGWVPASCPALQLLTLESLGPRAQPSLRAALQASALIRTTGVSLLPSWGRDTHSIPTPLLGCRAESQAGERRRARGCWRAEHPASRSHQAHRRWGQGQNSASAMSGPASWRAGTFSAGWGRACLSPPTSDPTEKTEPRPPPESALPGTEARRGPETPGAADLRPSVLDPGPGTSDSRWEMGGWNPGSTPTTWATLGERCRPGPPPPLQSGAETLIPRVKVSTSEPLRGTDVASRLSLLL